MYRRNSPEREGKKKKKEKDHAMVQACASRQSNRRRQQKAKDEKREHARDFNPVHPGSVKCPPRRFKVWGSPRYRG